MAYLIFCIGTFSVSARNIPAKDDTFATFNAKDALLICTYCDGLQTTFLTSLKKQLQNLYMTDISSIHLETDRLIVHPTQAEGWPFARDFRICEETMRHLVGHQQESDASRMLAQWIEPW